MRHKSALLLLAALIAAFPSHAAERLQVLYPKEFKIVHKQSNDAQSIVEYLPKEESLDLWTRMITFQTFKERDGANLEPETFILGMANRMRETACPDATIIPAKNGEQNGYSFSHYVLGCSDLNKIIMIKAVKGKHTLYLLQVEFNVRINDQEIRRWTVFLRDAVIVDN